MAHMTLPAEHTEADCRLAQRVGRTFGLEEVHVFWTLPTSEAAGGPPLAAPAAAPAPQADERADLPGGLIGALVAVGALFERLGARLVAR